MKPDLLVATRIPDAFLEELAADYTVHDLRGAEDGDALMAEVGPRIRALVTSGTSGLDAETIAALPALEFVACFGTGYENVDLEAAAARGITLTHGPGTNDTSVADLAIAMMLAVSRQLVRGDRMVRAGRWYAGKSENPTVTGKRLGILGLGQIGAEIAKRATGFDMEIGYHNRHQRADVVYRYFPGLIGLAEWADYLIASCPGGPETHHIIGREVLAALGPKGFVVNVARGSVVDTAALIEALKAEAIAGAGIDVIEGEPEVPEEMLGLENLTITPHIAGSSQEATRNKFDVFCANLRAYLAGEKVPNPIPGTLGE